MDIIYGKKYIQDNMIGQIVKLFESNYGKYHYKKFQSNNGVIELISDIQFDCVCIVDAHKICGFAGFYIKSNPQDTVLEIVMAHLLVDLSIRGKGYGTLLEESRLKMIERLNGKKVIYVSCVEKPYNSIQMKLDRDFYIGGFRYSYRPNKNMRGNGVIMICSKGVYRDNIYIEKPCAITQKILKRGNSIIRFKAEVMSNYYTIKVTKNEMLGRTICQILNTCDVGKKVNSIFLKQLKFNSNYVGVYLNPAIAGFRYIDKILLENSFYPLCYIPFINGGAGIIEYQYLKNGITGILQDNSISMVARDFLNSLM